MSIRVDSSSWIPGAIVVGNRGLGILADNIPATGDAGPSFLFNDVALPADSGKEVCGRVTSWPSAGTLLAYEDGSFEFSGAPDGTYSFTYSLLVDGASQGTGTGTLQVGSPAASFGINTADTTTAFGAVSKPIAAFSTSTAATIFAGGGGTIAAGGFTLATSDTTFAGGAETRPRAQMSITLGNVVFSGGATPAGTPATCSFALTTDDAVSAFSGEVLVAGASGGFAVTLDSAASLFSATGQAPTGLTLSQADIDAIAAAVLQALASLQPGVVQVNVTNPDQIAAGVWGFTVQ